MKPDDEKLTHYVVHKHAAWLCLAGASAVGIAFGFLVAVLVLV